MAARGVALSLCLLAAAAAVLLPQVLGGSRFSSIIDDPHFSSPDGVPFDFHGELDTSYCLVTDTRLHINARLNGYVDPTASLTSPLDLAGTKGNVAASFNRTWMKELGISWVDPRGTTHRLHLVARANRRPDRMHGYLERATLDGHVVKQPYDGRRIEKGPMLFQFTGVLKMPTEEQESFNLLIGDLLGASIIMRPAKKAFRTRTDAHVHFNVNFFLLNTTESVHGILGQTYRTSPEQKAKSAKFLQQVHLERRPVQVDHESGRGFLEGSVEDYETSGVTKPDCKFSRFQAGRQVQ